uniref:Uncharacterized protein n=1 Tax=Octopus bimaculoides TaxID=37653 RepID=A0A0L8HJZ9_OCTBM
MHTLYRPLFHMRRHNFKLYLKPIFKSFQLSYILQQILQILLLESFPPLRCHFNHQNTFLSFIPSFFLPAFIISSLTYSVLTHT